MPVLLCSQIRSEMLAAFVVVSALVIITPGPDTALTVRNALVWGRRGGILTASGIATGQAAWATLTALGVASLLRESAPLFLALRIAGAAYLIYLGLHSLLMSRRRPTESRDPGQSAQVITDLGRRRWIVPCRQGLVSNLANPKMVVFFLSLLPQFVGPSASFGTLVGLGLVFAALTFGWLAVYSVVIGKAGTLLRRPRIRRYLDRVTGAVLIALGIRMATEPV